MTRPSEHTSNSSHHATIDEGGNTTLPERKRKPVGEQRPMTALEHYVDQRYTQGYSLGQITRDLHTSGDDDVWSEIAPKGRTFFQSISWLRDEVVKPTLSANQERADAIVRKNKFIANITKRLINQLNDRTITTFSSTSMQDVYDFIENAGMNRETEDKFLIILYQMREEEMFVLRTSAQDKQSGAPMGNQLMIKDATRYVQSEDLSPVDIQMRGHLIFALTKYVENAYKQANTPPPVGIRYIVHYLISQLQANLKPKNTP